MSEFNGPEEIMQGIIFRLAPFSAHIVLRWIGVPFHFFILNYVFTFQYIFIALIFNPSIIFALMNKTLKIRSLLKKPIFHRFF